MTSSAEYPLHKAVFQNDPKGVASMLVDFDAKAIAQKDFHGNTPLHLAIMMGHKECALLLLEYNAPVKSRNLLGWNSLDEAISYGDRSMITTAFRKLYAQNREDYEARKPDVVAAMKKFGDFYLELRWDFHSWVPIVSAICRRLSDVCKIYKKRGSIRLDTTLVNFGENIWERGHVSFVFAAEADSDESLLMLDNKAKVYEKLTMDRENSESNVDDAMSNDIINGNMPTRTIGFRRAKSGWLFKEARTERVGEYRADYFEIDGLRLVTRKRREHLSAEDVKRNKEEMRMDASSDKQQKKTQKEKKRNSLPPPAKTNVSWDKYINSLPMGYPSLGRPHVIKESTKALKATVAMSEEFPLTIKALLDLLEIVAPFKHLEKLRQFCKMNLPPGFPVQIEMPLFPTISAKVTFQKLQFRTDLSSSLFEVPKNYREDARHFRL